LARHSLTASCSAFRSISGVDSGICRVIKFVAISVNIPVGKLADFTVFSENIMEIPEDEILETEVVYTIVDGEVYEQMP